MDCKNFLVVLVIAFSHVSFVASSNSKIVNSFESYTVQIIDGSIENLLAHIASKDTDLGNKKMTINGVFQWSFRRNFDDTTLFRGEFFWLDVDDTPLREVDFNVFDKNVAKECVMDHHCNLAIPQGPSLQSGYTTGTIRISVLYVELATTVYPQGYQCHYMWLFRHTYCSTYLLVFADIRDNMTESYAPSLLGRNTVMLMSIAAEISG
ncbi:hypothetical protein R6Q59_016294 [Mikania micrantha]